MKPLQERSLVVKETGEKVPFSEFGSGQMRDLIDGWDRGESVTIQGVMSDADLFSGRIGNQLKIAADFVSGEETEDGDVYYGTAKMHPVATVNDGNTSTSFSLKSGKGGLTIQL